MKFEKVQLVLAVFENNQARVYDSRDFKLIQDIEFPFQMTTQKPRIKVRPQTSMLNEAKQQSRERSAAMDTID
jgi:hypothetical protein